MAVNTILIDFSVDPSQLKNESQCSLISTNIENILRDYLSNLKLAFSLPIDGGLLKLYQCDFGAVVALRIFSNGIITINVEYYKGDKQEPLLTYEHSKDIEHKINAIINAYRSKMFPPIKRGSTLDVYLTSSGKSKQIERDVVEMAIGIKRSQAFVPIKRGTFDRYFPSSDERLLEYDIDEVVFEERTQYQKVQIVHSKSLGNMLVLDDLQNISEADLIYTETLMARGKEEYKDKDIVILGGGDGALLYELLKEQPKNVIMLEIDDIVMKACAKYMRSICGDVLDARSGPHYQIIVGDCMKSLDEFIKEGRKFDYVFGDLTDIPISSTPSNELWNFILKILEYSFKILKPNGKFMTHGNGTSCSEALEMYESQLNKLQPPVEICKSTAFVPSFLEDWVFYQINFAKKK